MMLLAFQLGTALPLMYVSEGVQLIYGLQIKGSTT